MQQEDTDKNWHQYKLFRLI